MIRKMDKLKFDYRNCDQYDSSNLITLQQFENDFDLNKHKNLKRMNLTLDLPNTHEQNAIDFTPKLFTPVVSNFLNFNDELKNQASPNLFKESNPFAETFKQATLNNRSKNPDRTVQVDSNGSLSTPPIDFKCLESRNFFNKSLPISSKLDLLISASNEQYLFDNQTNEAVSQGNDEKIRPRTRANKHILPKQVYSNDVPSYKVFLKLPDGSSLSIPTVVTNYNSQTKNTPIDDLEASSLYQINESIASTRSQITSNTKGRRNSRSTKNKYAEKVETTTLKSIKTALAESSTSHSSPRLESATDLIKYELINSCSQSSQSSTTSSLYGLSAKDTIHDNFNSAFAELPASSASSQSSTVNSNKGSNSRSRPGRKGKNQSKEDPNEKKSRSLKRNREAASRCRTKRKIWENALEQKASELEKKNKELIGIYEKLKYDIQQLKSALLNNKTTTITATSTNLQGTFSNKISEHSSDNETIKSNSFDVLLQAANNSD